MDDATLAIERSGAVFHRCGWHRGTGIVGTVGRSTTTTGRGGTTGRGLSGTTGSSTSTLAIATLVAATTLVAAALAVGALPVGLCLAVVLPVLGHSTWHLYRKVVSADEVI